NCRDPRSDVAISWRTTVAHHPMEDNRCRSLSTATCENFLYYFKAAPRAARAADTAARPPLPLTLPLRPAHAGRLARRAQSFGAAKPGSHQGRGGFDKGTLAAAHIGLIAGRLKPARSAGKRTGRRPLSNPPLRLRGPSRRGRLSLKILTYA